MLRLSSSSTKFQLLPLTAAVASALTSTTAAVAEEALVLEEIIVTARKRTESVQDIPASIQAISGADLQAMGARGMEDFTRFMPSVNVISYGNGSSSVIFRGATIDGGGYVAQATSSVYLDEVSITSTGDQPSVRMVDIAQVEALAGPQGTLYGSDAQAGTLRIITNKPVMNEFFLELDGSVRSGEDSDDSYDGSIVLNLPIVDDTLALRVVAFTAKDGGFIDNVFGHTPDVSVTGQPWDVMDFGSLDNAKYVKDEVNDSEIDGWRAALKWDINENWSATAGYLHQETDNGALNFYDPYVGDLKKVNFFDDYSSDDYDLYSLTVEADLGFAQLVSATSYYERDTTWGQDITAYHHYWTGAYWSCAYANDSLDPDTYYWYYFTPDGLYLYNGAYCLAPTVNGDYLSTIQEVAHQDRFTQEIRLSAQGDTIDWLVGLYYEDSENSWESDFADVTDGDFQQSIALDFYEFFDDATYPEATHAWDSFSDSTWDQYAVFGEVVWHATDKVDVTIGGRYFDRDTENTYYVERPNTRQDLDVYPNGPTVHEGNDTEFAPKIAVSYSFTDDVMAYALYTEGYRPGGTNRIRGEPLFPSQFEPDTMTNYEMGFRSTILNGAGRFNATVFYLDWEDYQLELVDPAFQNCPADGPNSIPRVCGQPWQVSIGNAGDAHILGVNMEFDWALSQNWVFGMNAEWLEAENDTDMEALGLEVEDGDDLPTVADWTGAAWLNYEQPMDYFGGSSFYARLQWSYRGESNNILEKYPADGSSANPQLENPSSDIGDLILGVRGDTWEVSAFVNNLTDERAVYQIESGAFEWGAASSIDGRPHTQKSYINRPREYGIRVIKRWGG